MNMQTCKYAFNNDTHVDCFNENRRVFKKFLWFKWSYIPKCCLGFDSIIGCIYRVERKKFIVNIKGYAVKKYE